jgi:hypothetical protein
MGTLYEHWRTDLNECFYVGASWENPETRPYQTNARGHRYDATLLEIEANKASVEIRIIECSHLNDVELAQLEVFQIAYWKDLIGKRLTNIHPGGGGLLVDWDEDLRKRHSEILTKAGQKRWDDATQEERDAHSAAVKAGHKKWREGLTEEEYYNHFKPFRDYLDNLTFEERSETTRSWQAKKTPEERKATAQKAADSQTPEQHRANALKAAANQTPEKRKQNAIKGAASRSKEQNIEAGKKSWETRRRNKLLKAQAQVP